MRTFIWVMLMIQSLGFMLNVEQAWKPQPKTFTAEQRLRIALATMLLQMPLIVWACFLLSE
jgi:hypothetical protein